MWTPIDGRGLSIPQIRTHVAQLDFPRWRPSGMCLHNTGAPKLSQWHDENAASRIISLEHYFRDERGWPSGPHAFVDDKLVWLFTPFDCPGTHSPSWNATKLGIEMVGDFATEDDDSGRGLKVKQNTAALFAILHARLGIDPDTIVLHKEDKRTTHDCPGADIDKAEFIDMVHQYMAGGGEHDYGELPITGTPPAAPPAIRGGVVKIPPRNVLIADTLNVRSAPGMAGKVIAALDDGAKVGVLEAAMNRDTKWLRITMGDNRTGWVAARFVDMVASV